MSEPLDGLARALARPMPRRRALRLLGAMLVGAAAPAAVAPSAGARAREDCDAGEVRRTGEMCRDLTRETGRRVVPCYAPGGGMCFSTCCSPGEYCCRHRTGGVTCCAPRPGGVCPRTPPQFGDPCLGRCRPNEVRCGRTCCPPGQRCKQGRCCKPCGEEACCPRGEACCGDRCCKRGERCGTYGRGSSRQHICCRTRSCQARPGARPFCCPHPNETCLPRWSGGVAPNAEKVCCPPPRVVRGTSNAVACCPEGTVSVGEGLIVGGGIDGACCPQAQVCGSTCCPSDGGVLQQCCDGACADVRFDPLNCGSCGVICAGGQRCQDGLCVTA